MIDRIARYLTRWLAPRAALDEALMMVANQRITIDLQDRRIRQLELEAKLLEELI